MEVGTVCADDPLLLGILLRFYVGIHHVFLYISVLLYLRLCRLLSTL